MIYELLAELPLAVLEVSIRSLPPSTTVSSPPPSLAEGGDLPAPRRLTSRLKVQSIFHSLCFITKNNECSFFLSSLTMNHHKNQIFPQAPAIGIFSIKHKIYHIYYTFTQRKILTIILNINIFVNCKLAKFFYRSTDLRTPPSNFLN